jgi:hypothetical protein
MGFVGTSTNTDALGGRSSGGCGSFFNGGACRFTNSNGSTYIFGWGRGPGVTGYYEQNMTSPSRAQVPWTFFFPTRM